jgi:hypothetical protein
MRLSARLAGLAVGVALLVAPGSATAAIVNNGDFETGDFSGWQLNDTGPGLWNVYSGTVVGGFPVPAPPQGTHAAITTQGEVSRQILYQDVTLPSGASQTQLSLFAYYTAEAPIFSPDTLSIADTNEQYRIDVMKPSAPLDSVAAGDILATVFRTVTGDPAVLVPTIKTADLTPFAGQTVRLRLAVAVTQNELNGGADAISVVSNGFSVGTTTLNKKKGTATVPVTVPEAGTLDVSGKGVKPRFTAASTSVAAGTSNVVIKPKGKTRKKLNSRGKAKVKLSITYTPTGLTGNTEETQVKLKKKH